MDEAKLKKYNIAIAGVGVIGSELLNYINNKLDNQENNQVQKIVTHISTRKERNIENLEWVDNPLKLLEIDDINLIIELIGGANGIAYELVKNSLKKGKNIVTANKALIAEHGNELFNIAKDNNCTLFFEAAVGGALPIIKLLNDNLSNNNIKKISGILNGTCNFILSKMEEENYDFDKALKIAQEKGFAEPDPYLDISAIDAAHKIAIISSLAFNTEISFDNVKINSIENITSDIIKIAKNQNYSVKLLAVAINTNNKIIQYVRPCFIGKNHNLKNINKALNSVNIESDPALMTNIIGHGAGSKPTTSALLSDINDAIRNIKHHYNFNNKNIYCNELDIEQRFIAIAKDNIELESITRKLDELNIIYSISDYQNNKIIKFKTNNFSDSYNINHQNIFEIHE
ncbi:MAG: homoserine dehydrogenase [Rickettsiales bacterium]|nr:homoserine dehydrogenase [Rickettsiales bacterium]